MKRFLEGFRAVGRHESLVAAVRRALPFVLIGATFGLFWYAGSYRTEISWNVIDLGIGRNLLRGEGFVDFPGAPPNLWRQPLAPVLAGLSELVFDDALTTFHLIFAASLTSATWFVFLTARRLIGPGAGLLAAGLTATSPALLVTLTANVHTITDVLLLGIIGPAMYCVLVAGETRALRFYALAGLLLGLAFMANVAGLLYLPAAVLWLLVAQPHSGGTEDRAEARSWVRRHQSLSGIALVVVLVAVISAPHVAYLTAQRAEFTINVHGIYGFYSAEGWVYHLQGDTEEAGYQQAVQKYGTPEENGFSIARAVLRNPAAFRERVERNLGRLARSFSSKEMFPIALIPLMLIGLIFSPRHARQGVFLVALFGLPIFAYLAHVADSRYLSHAVPSAAVLAAIGLRQAVGPIRRYAGNPWTFTAVISIAVATLAFLWTDGTVDYWQRSSRTPSDPAHRIAEKLRSDLGVSRNDALKDTTECCFFGPALAYYADTGYSWNNSNNPRTTLLSMPNLPDVDYRVVSSTQAVRHTFASRPLLVYLDPQVGHIWVYDGHTDNEMSLLAEVLTPNAAEFRTAVFEIGEQIKPVLLMEDPLPRSASLTVAIDRPLTLQGDVTTAPYHWSYPGDGIRFRILIVDEGGEEREGLDLWIDPKNNSSDRRWHHVSVDLSPYFGQTVELVLTVESGSDPEFDHAAWANIRVTPLEGR